MARSMWGGIAGALTGGLVAGLDQEQINRKAAAAEAIRQAALKRQAELDKLAADERARQAAREGKLDARQDRLDADTREREDLKLWSQGISRGGTNITVQEAGVEDTNPLAPGSLGGAFSRGANAMGLGAQNADPLSAGQNKPAETRRLLPSLPKLKFDTTGPTYNRAGDIDRVTKDEQLAEERKYKEKDADKQYARDITLAGIRARNSAPAMPSWGLTYTQDGQAVQVNPKTGDTRIVNGPDGKPLTKQASQAQGVNHRGVKLLEKVNSNEAAIRRMDEAIAEVDRNPRAFGLKRFSDTVNQFVDKEGTNARDMVSNIGSLVVHERSGAAVPIAEFKRIAPTIPSITDQSDKVLVNLRNMRKNLAVETEGLRRLVGSAPSAPAPSADEQFIEQQLEAGKSPAEAAAALRASKGKK